MVDLAAKQQQHRNHSETKFMLLMKECILSRTRSDSVTPVTIFGYSTHVFNRMTRLEQWCARVIFVGSEPFESEWSEILSSRVMTWSSRVTRMVESLVYKLESYKF